MTVRRFAALNYFVETVQGFQMQGHSTGREKARGLAVSEQRGYAAAAKRKIPARAMDFAIYDLCVTGVPRFACQGGASAGCPAHRTILLQVFLA